MSIMELIVANVKSLVRDRMALFWFLAFPVFFILIFGAVFSGGHQPSFAIGLVHAPDDPLAGGLSSGFAQVKSFRVHTGTREQELAALRKGHRALVVEIPSGAAASAAAGRTTEVPVYFDSSREQTGRMLFTVVTQMLDEAERRMSGRPRVFVAQLLPFEATPLRSIDFLLPGILGMALMQLGLFGALQTAHLREQKVLKALGATPLPRSSMVGAEVLVRLLLSVVQLAVTAAVGVLVFRLQVVGNWLAILGVVVLGALTFISLGYLLTCRSRTVESAMGIVQIVQFPMMFLSAIFFPTSAMPGFLRPVTAALPLTYLGDALRQVMVGMPADHSLASCLLVLTGWLVVTMTLTVVLWRWE